MCFSVQIEKDLKKIATRFGLAIDWESFEIIQKKLEIGGLKVRHPDQDTRIFPGTFAPLIVLKNGKRTLIPSRYRIRPARSLNEIPDKFNVYNAREDSLYSRDTWKKLIGRNHALLPFKKFYEWVEAEGKKKQVVFTPQDDEWIWAPALFDVWKEGKKNEELHSFAIITTDPHPVVAEAGHDRSPLVIKEEKIQEWLEGKTEALQDLRSINYSVKELEDNTKYQLELF